MNLYYFIFIWIAVIGMISLITKNEVPVLVNGKIEYRWNLIIAFIAFAPIFLLATVGKPVHDTVLYLDIFKEIPIDAVEITQRINEAESGKGFIIFQYLIKRVFGNNEVAFRLILGLLQTIPVVCIFRRYSENYIMSLFLFTATSCHISWMMNGLRQFLAVAIIFAATPLLIKKKYIALIIVIGLAATIHTSALIMLPVIFIVQGKAWNSKTIIYIIVAVVAMYLFGKYTNLMDSFLVGTEYENFTATWTELGDNGANPIRVAVNAVPMVISLFTLKYIDRNDRVVNICINMSIITTGLYLIAVTTSGIMIGRLPIYTSLYNCILLPYLINRVFTKESTIIVYAAMIILYFIYYLVETGGI